MNIAQYKNGFMEISGTESHVVPTSAYTQIGTSGIWYARFGNVEFPIPFINTPIVIFNASSTGVNFSLNSIPTPTGFNPWIGQYGGTERVISVYFSAIGYYK